jgi:hypothetical protein
MQNNLKNNLLDKTIRAEYLPRNSPKTWYLTRKLAPSADSGLYNPFIFSLKLQENEYRVFCVMAG